MKSFKQLMEEIREAKPDKTLEPVEQSVEKRLSSDHPHSVLHEILVHAHLNRLISGESELNPTHYSKEAIKHEDSARQRTQENFIAASGKKTRKPTVADVENKAKVDAQSLFDQLKEKHGWGENTRAHWTPTTSSRRSLHPDETHSGDITIINDKNSKSVSPSASINLKWGKGGSLSVPRQNAISSFMRGKLRKKVRRVFKRIKNQPTGQTSEARNRDIGELADRHSNAFNKLGQDDKFKFIKRMYGVSDTPSKIKSYTFHSSSNSLLNNDEEFSRLFPKGGNHEFTAVRNGRTMRIYRDGKHLRSLSWRYNNGRLEPNLKSVKGEQEQT